MLTSDRPLPGQNIAETVCARCHDVGHRTTPGGHSVDGSPPTFAELARDPKVTAAMLYEFLRFPHGEMSHLFVTQQEADSLIVYIQSFNRTNAGGNPR